MAISRAVSRRSSLFSAEDLISRLKERAVDTQYVREYYLPFKVSPDRLAVLDEALKEEGLLNTDLRPVAYFFDIVLQGPIGGK